MNIIIILKKVPTCFDLGLENNLPSGVVFYDRFETQSWNEILEECGLELNHYQGHTDETALEMLREVYNKYKRVLTQEEWKDYNILPNHDYYYKNFGGMEKACIIAGVPFENLASRGTICKDLRGELCRSVKEMEITNFLIFNKIEYEKEVPYRKVINELNDYRRFDWVIKINNSTFYIEYAGLYTYGVKSIGDEYVRKIHKKIEDLKKYKYWDNALFIYPKDLKKYKISEFFNNKFNTNFKEYIQ